MTRLGARTATLAALGLALALAPGAFGQGADAGKPPDRVLGGTATSIEEFPWQVAIVLDGRPTFDGLQCGGSLVAPTWVLTAAHCFDDPLARYSVFRGSASLDGGVTVGVKRIILHPDYDPDLSQNDIALVELVEPSPDQPIQLASVIETAFDETFGVMAVVSGWGEYRPVVERDGGLYDMATGLAVTAEEADDWRRPRELRSVGVPVVALDECGRAFRAYADEVGAGPDAPIRAVLDGRVVCAGAVGQGIDACNGDSGGPLQVMRDGGRYTQIGLVSWGLRCSSGGFYNIYTRVAAFRGWIADVSAGRAGGLEPRDPNFPATPPEYEALVLAAGFANEDGARMLRAGGDYSAARLGGLCTGYIAGPPDFSVDFAPGGASLHVSVASVADTTLVVLSPDGRLSCSDDYAPPLRNPSVGFDAPLAGVYRVWVGTYADATGGELPLAALHITEGAPRFE
jgi:secreted trypsin-like serine protease